MKTVCTNDHCQGILVYDGLVTKRGVITHERYKCVRCWHIQLEPVESAPPLLTGDEDTEPLAIVRDEVQS